VAEYISFKLLIQWINIQLIVDTAYRLQHIKMSQLEHKTITNIPNLTFNKYFTESQSEATDLR
jgi:hypothetical protein